MSEANIVLLHKPIHSFAWEGGLLKIIDFRTEATADTLPYLDLSGSWSNHPRTRQLDMSLESVGLFGRGSQPCFGYIINARDDSRAYHYWN